MILNNNPIDTAVMGNIGGINAFNLKPSAKAFSILSSGLYSNKIRAVIREPCCNAYDSHVLANKADVPFVVHLPSKFSPYFYVQDFGVGLDHDEIINVFSVYFESSKIKSNDFIGALGLGSKSPFSYTTNYTITSIKDNIKRIYTAFMDDNNFPNIAKMGDDVHTDESNGVEIRFAVKEEDFVKFNSEAMFVFQYFKVHPTVIGNSLYKPQKIEYYNKDIIPGVHYMNNYKSDYKNNTSIAVMGNVAYPINVPSNELDKYLEYLLNCRLELNFEIGELDFQASREELSYIPMTVNAIKNKLIALNNVLVDKVKKDLSTISNTWEKISYISDRMCDPLWSSSIREVELSLNLLSDPIFMFESDLANSFNIKINMLHLVAYNTTFSTVYPYKAFNNKTDSYEQGRKFFFKKYFLFVKNDTKVGGIERVKYHFSKPQHRNNGVTDVILLEPVDKTQPVKYDEFFNAIRNPPTSQICKLSELDIKPTATRKNKSAAIFKLSDFERWVNRGYISEFPVDKTFYYIELSGFKIVSKYNFTKNTINRLNNTMHPKFTNIDVYGVRQSEINQVKNMSNWVKLEDYVYAVLTNIDETELLGFAKNEYYNSLKFNHVFDIIRSKIDDNSEYAKYIDWFNSINKVSINIKNLERVAFVFNHYIQYQEVFNKFNKRCLELNKKYPLIDSLINVTPVEQVINYINLVDKS